MSKEEAASSMGGGGGSGGGGGGGEVQEDVASKLLIELREGSRMGGGGGGGGGGSGGGIGGVGGEDAATRRWRQPFECFRSYRLNEGGGGGGGGGRIIGGVGGEDEATRRWPVQEILQALRDTPALFEHAWRPPSSYAPLEGAGLHGRLLHRAKEIAARSSLGGGRGGGGGVEEKEEKKAVMTTKKPTKKEIAKVEAKKIALKKQKQKEKKQAESDRWRELEAKRRDRAEAMEANRAYQATRLYSTPPVYGECDERRETGDYGLTHMVMTITKRRCFAAIIRYLKPSEAALVKQARKMFGSAVEAAEEEIVRHLHALHFARVPLPLAGGRGTCFSWTRYLHELSTNKSHKLLIMGGRDGDGYMTDRVDMIFIDEEGAKVPSFLCAPMIESRWGQAAIYYQGQILSACGSVSSLDGRNTCERYDVLSQTAVELEQLPIPNLDRVALAELDGKTFAIGGKYKDAATGRLVRSDRIFCLNNKRHRGQAGTWIEQEARLITARSHAAAATYQGKVWLAGGRDGNGRPLSSIEVFDPLVGSWQAAGDLTIARDESFVLFAIKDDLYAAGSTNSGLMRVGKRDGQTGAWQLVSELHDDNGREGCVLVACGSTIYFLGGIYYEYQRAKGRFFNHRAQKPSDNKSWNSFDTRTSTWASQHGQFRNKIARKLSRTFSFGQAVCITPSEQLSCLDTWTSYPDFVHHE